MLIEPPRTMKHLVLVLLAIATAWPLMAANPLPAVARRTPMRLIQTTEPIFPHNLSRTIREGEARVVISVDANGLLRDLLIIGYTKKAFADEAVSALREWRYEPARVEGEPVSATAEISFRFEATGVIVDQNVMESAQAMLFWWERNQYDYALCTLKDLDRIPVPKAAKAPPYPSTLAAQGIAGEVLVVFYIDEQGAVRMPAVSRADDLRLADLAVQALMGWQFEPPTKQGKPTLVKATQLFKFRPTVMPHQGQAPAKP